MPQSPGPPVGVRPSKYQPLADYLVARTKDEITLTFAEIEKIIRGALPTTAHVETWYWNGTATQRQAVPERLLGAIGWRARLDRRNARVTFTHDGWQQVE